MQLHIKESAKLLLNQWQRFTVGLGRLLGIIDFPVPLNSSMRKTSSKTVRHYYESAVTCSLPIETMALHFGVNLRGKINVLDFGCGVGRQLLNFTRKFPEPTYFACDVDHSAVAFISRNYPSVSARTSRFSPPLPFNGESMDMIYSVSTFSHISPEQQGDWLSEIYRVTRPNGYCFLTTEGWTAFTASNDLRSSLSSEAGENELRAKGIIYKEYEDLAKNRQHKALTPALQHNLGIDKSYGSTVMTPEFIREKWSRTGFEVVAIVEGVIDYRQDLVVLRKPGIAGKSSGISAATAAE